MLKICGDSIWISLKSFFKKVLLTGVFPSEWKKQNIVPIHKKNHPVSLLPKDLLLAKCLTIPSAINSAVRTSPISNPVISVSTNCYQLPTKFLHLLIMDWKSEVFF